MTTFGRWLEDFAQDLRYSIRVLSRNRAFTATALTALALGIGANAAIFSVVRGAVLRPLPFPDPERLVQLYGTPAERGEAIAASDVEQFRTAGTSFDAIAGYSVSARYFRGPDGPERVMTVDAERSFFSMLGIQAMAGRTFAPDDPSGVALISESFWHRRFRGDPTAIGQSVTLDDAPVRIIGVMPGSFQFPYGAASLLSSAASEARTDLWILLEVPPGQARRGRLGFVTGRLRPNVSLSTARSELSLIVGRIQTQNPNRPRDIGVRIVRLSEAVVAAPIRRSLFLLFGAVWIVLTLACANVTNLFLVRLTTRRHEIAARMALGASPFRLMRQVLTESFLLALIGGVVGLSLAWWGTGRLLQLAHIPRSHEIAVDWQVFLFLLSVCLLTAILFGLAPALSVMRADTRSLIRQIASTMSLPQQRLRDGLVIAEVGLAFVLGVGAAVLIRELVRLSNTEMGMVTENVVTLHLGHRMTPSTDVGQFYEIADRVAALPGVREAGFTQMLPLQSWGWTGNSLDFRLRGRPATETSIFTMELRYVTPGYFQALGIPIKQGRGFTAQDVRGALPVIVINETLAKRVFDTEDPIGKETTRGTIVGVVGDVRQVHLDRPAAPEVYYAMAQNWSQVSELGVSLVVRSDGSPLAPIDGIRRVIREVNPNLAIFNIKTMDRVVADSLSDFTLYLSLMGGFAVLALFLASTGAYGVISYVANSRLREFAIRSALGAERTEVMRLVIGQAVRVTLAGLAFGLAGVVAATPLLRNLPVSVRPPDLTTIVPVAVVIGVVAVVACLVPARRAANADPMSTLRSE